MLPRTTLGGQRAVLEQRALVRPQRLARMATRCEVRSNKGKKLSEESISVKNSLGEGSFGLVFTGSLTGADGSSSSRIILKKVKEKVSGAQEMGEMEHILNVYAKSACPSAVAPFLGYLVVSEPRGRLTRGLWLVWEYQGDKTLGYYLRRRDCIAALSADLGVAEEAAVPTVMKQIFECLTQVHNAGLVHRDVKPANIVFSDAERRFKLIDLGAAADLRTGTNYKPQETILDPLYAAPEEYVLPTDAPHLSEKAAPLAMVMSPLLWQQHRPDCFDTWSAGVILLQLGLPFMRSATSLRNWKGTFARCGYDLQEWRMRASLTAKQTALLDADDGAGWDLAAGLLRPREVEGDSKGGVRFKNTAAAPRLTPTAALRHPYLKKAAGSKAAGSSFGRSFSSLFSVSTDGDDSGSIDLSVGDSAATAGGSSGSRGSKSRSRRSSGSNSSSSSSSAAKEAAESSVAAAAARSSSPSRLSSTWGWMKAKLFDLEARVSQQASDTQTQTTVVQKLKEDVAAGRASEKELEKEETRLQGMQASLQASAKELNSLYGAARGFFASVVKPGGGIGMPSPAAATAAAGSMERDEEQQQASSASASGSAVGKAVADAATNVLYSGLRFTGMALNAVGDLAEAVEKRASKAAAEVEARRAASSAFVEALQSVQPPITARSTWESVAAALDSSARASSYEGLTEGQRKETFRAYVDALKRRERAAAQAAVASFSALLSERGLDSSATYEQLCTGPAATDPRFFAIGAEDERRAAFDAFLEKIRAQEARATAAAARKLEEEERRANLVAAAAAKAAAKAAEVAAQKSEEERRAAAAAAATAAASALAEQYKREQEEREAAAAAEAEKAATATAAATPSPAAAAGPDPQELEFLRQEQKRMAEEYRRMELKLLEMEKRLSVKELVGALIDDGSVVEADSEGNVIFRFAPTSAPLTDKKQAAKGTRRGERAPKPKKLI